MSGTLPDEKGSFGVAPPALSLIMNVDLLNKLRCPFCGGSLNVSTRGQELSGQLEYGVLSCYCQRYPVVAGIPILKKRGISVTHTNDEVVDLIKAGRNQDALLAVLTPAPPNVASLAPKWAGLLPSFRGMGRIKTVLGQPALQRWKKQAEAVLKAPKDRVSVIDFLKLYFRADSDPDRDQTANYNYFAFRLSQPRYLVALSLASLVRQCDGTVLDLACGFGNITRYLARQAKGRMVIGIDENFFGLYCARNWLVPEAQFVCATADVSLPLATQSCALAFCSDAFHLFLNQSTCMGELKRVTQTDGIMILASLPNGLVKKRRKSSIIPSLPPAAYEDLISDIPHRLVNNQMILDRYLQKQGPALANIDPDAVGNGQWLSIVASMNSQVFVDYPAFTDWPHVEVDPLGLNPLYRRNQADPAGSISLRLQFPSTWYAQEDASIDGRYLPESAMISSKVITDIAEKKRSDEIEKLIAQGIVVGIPEHYLPQTIDPLRT
jgi:SAM-dependent methyltransferase